MNVLSKEFRSILEVTVIKAREVAEAASKIVLEQLGVDSSTPYSYLSDEQKVLRRKLRAHGRQMGDCRNSKSQTQEIERLIEEVAYQHWHRMLFARFLAENQLLMFYDGDEIENAVSVTLEECNELAFELGYSNGWELASMLASKMLPQIFRPGSPVYELHFPIEKQKVLEKLLSDLPREVFSAIDSLGWVYQFWQTKKKKAVNSSEVKIGARELPAVTQLFTEPYMVSFILDNSVGAWWARRKLTNNDLQMASTEEELREKASLKGVPLEYLRFNKEKDKNLWVPISGYYDTWPDEISELRIIDPCCGSGHFLVSAFLMLVPIRMALEGLTAEEACDAVLLENIYGLELDQRCVEIAAFAVALTAWKYSGTRGFRRLPNLNIAWCGQSINVTRDKWLSMAAGDEVLEIYLEGFYTIFKDAPVLGSLINPHRYFNEDTLFNIDWKQVRGILKQLLQKENSFDDLEIAALAQGLWKAYELLDNKYHLVVTNVPYLTLKRQNDIMKNYISTLFPISKYELATAFIERSLDLLAEDNGFIGAVTPINWTSLKSYKNFRKMLLDDNQILNISNLGEGAFESISGEVVKVLLLLMSNSKIYKENSIFHGIDCTESSNKPEALRINSIISIDQNQQYNNPDQRILINNLSESSLLNKYSFSKRGIVTGDNERWIRKFWEVTPGGKWKFLQSAVTTTEFYSGRENVIDWSTNGKGMLRPGIGNSTYSKFGIAVSRMGDLRATIYTGELYDQNTGAIVPYEDENIPAIWCYCESEHYSKAVRVIDKKVNVTNATLIQVPFDRDYWKKVAELKYPNGLPKPYSDNPTQWLFHGYPSISEKQLQVAVAKMLGYSWPAENDESLDLSIKGRMLVEKSHDILPYVEEDGIVCINPVRGEASAADKLLNILAEVYKGENVNEIVSDLLASTGSAGKSLELWLRDKFFIEHVKLFENRPFIWQIWDGLSDGFSALVNYHMFDRKSLETLIYTYLGDWINKQKADIKDNIDGADEKLAAAESLKKSLELILKGEAPYDIFIRWKPIHEQPIGWNPDVNDGIRVNIRPFMSVPDVGKRNAGVLRDKPNIKWDKDRGKDDISRPWYSEFKGERINDRHLTLEEKIVFKDKIKKR
jgi:hypothetical protein